jgi:hypothetical protein
MFNMRPNTLIYGARYDRMMDAFGGKGFFVEDPKDPLPDAPPRRPRPVAAVARGIAGGDEGRRRGGGGSWRSMPEATAAAVTVTPAVSANGPLALEFLEARNIYLADRPTRGISLLFTELDAPAQQLPRPGSTPLGWNRSSLNRYSPNPRLLVSVRAFWATGCRLISS